MLKASLLVGVGAVIGIGAIGSFIYWQGSKSCAPRYQAKILKAQIKNRDIALAYYKSATANQKNLTEEAERNAAEKETKLAAIEKHIKDTPISSISCIDDEFVRSIRGTR